MKSLRVVFLLLPVLFIWPACDPSYLYLTEVSGKLDVTNSCASEFPSHIHVMGYIDLRYEYFDADSIPIEADGTFYRAFSGAEFLRWKGTGDCADTYYQIHKGKSQVAQMRPVSLTDSISLRISKSMFHPESGSIIIELKRLHRVDRNRVRILPKDPTSLNLFLDEPIDTLLRFRLALDQQYHFRISESPPQMARRDVVPLQTIRASRNLREIIP